ncbi:DUF550 domain-containing protein [Salmonella enterica]|nr:DUF550 domain-containing protein [Salmonella enterica]
MTTITREQLHERARRKVKELEFAITQSAFTSIRDGLNEELELARIALAALTAEPVLYAAEETLAYANMGEIHLTCLSEPMGDAVIPLYTDSPVSERERIRREHAEWSDKTFGDVGPVGPLKHLSKEALETAAEPSDLSEWADMQFLLWDAQRRAGITDEQIALAMVEKLAVNKKREWPEPKDGEPRLHIKEQSAPVIPDGWISCSERMPEDEQEVIVHNKLGYRYVSYFDEHSGLFFDMRGGNQMNCIEHILVTHWMPLPAAPEPEQS